MARHSCHSSSVHFASNTAVFTGVASGFTLKHNRLIGQFIPAIADGWKTLFMSNAISLAGDTAFPREVFIYPRPDETKRKPEQQFLQRQAVNEHAAQRLEVPDLFDVTRCRPLETQQEHRVEREEQY